MWIPQLAGPLGSAEQSVNRKRWGPRIRGPPPGPVPYRLGHVVLGLLRRGETLEIGVGADGKRFCFIPRCTDSRNMTQMYRIDNRGCGSCEVWNSGVEVWICLGSGGEGAKVGRLLSGSPDGLNPIDQVLALSEKTVGWTTWSSWVIW